MSTSASFELQSNVPEQEILNRLRSLWDVPLGFSYEAGVFRDPAVGYCVDLCWFFGEPREDEQARRVIKYLLSISSDGLYYLRNPDCYVRGSDPDYPRPITMDEVFRPEFRPTLNAGTECRYLIQMDNVSTQKAEG